MMLAARYRTWEFDAHWQAPQVEVLLQWAAWIRLWKCHLQGVIAGHELMGSSDSACQRSSLPLVQALTCLKTLKQETTLNEHHLEVYEVSCMNMRPILSKPSCISVDLVGQGLAISLDFGEALAMAESKDREGWLTKRRAELHFCGCQLMVQPFRVLPGGRASTEQAVK